MMPLIIEKGLMFNFPDGWSAVKFDATRVYRRNPLNAKGLKGVDILAASPEGELWMIEAKDFRLGRVQNRRRNILLTLAEETAWKAHDTMTILISAFRTNTSYDTGVAFLAGMVGRNARLPVRSVCVLLEDHQVIQNKFARERRNVERTSLQHLLRPMKIEGDILEPKEVRELLLPWTCEVSRP